jgi:hypothetical protein
MIVTAQWVNLNHDPDGPVLCSACGLVREPGAGGWWTHTEPGARYYRAPGRRPSTTYYACPRCAAPYLCRVCGEPVTDSVQLSLSDPRPIHFICIDPFLARERTATDQNRASN